MRLLPRSLAGRLLAISTLAMALALALAAIGIGHVLERFVMRGLDQQLDTQIGMLARAVRPDGTLDAARVVDLPSFARAEPGWGWRVDGPRGRWQSGDGIRAEDRRLIAPPHSHPEPGGTRPVEGMTRSGERVHLRMLSVETAAGPVRIVASVPRRMLRAPLREAMVPLLGSLAILGAVLALAIVLQVRLGLRPLRRLGASIADVRSGRARTVPVDQPDELRPLATELNALVEQNAAQLDQARRHVANLAHGLKTPLAALSLKLAESGADADGSLRALIADLDARVRHHLGRARIVSPGGGRREGAMLAPAVTDLLKVMERVHADRNIAWHAAVAPDLAVAADRQDLDEMLGNLLDNAFRHATMQVSVHAERQGPLIAITVDDDGAGLTGQAIAEALVPGRRLDERGDGHGFGLPITQELAELNGGSLALHPALSGRGLRATLMLPAGAVAS
ncbi:sensor histidine kinase [Sphingomonas jatrophae]|uniref:histidine kinase n=1 Tax=Sphingomonas jatrophae TaxID=1166337 RepID=A0A1I6M9P2_9SPHN|nr:HAMP domain-containing sensor histidine kinase [Sphingomonas jatrophae]SFS12444.1 Signal transduction histidine kinase [Sphingomonas jatrophae]